MSGTSHIHVSGIGLVSPLGDDLNAAWERLLRGDGAVKRLSFAGLPDIAAAVVDGDLGDGLTKLQRVGTERVSQMALGAARRALADAGLERWPDPERVGVFVGTGMGGAQTLDAGFAALHSGNRLPPLTVPAGMVNGAAAVIAMFLDVQGPAMTYAMACASSAVAIAEAAHALRRGDIDIALAGGVEAPLTRGTVAAWQAMRTLAAPGDHDVAGACRPFAPDRAGLVLGEGSAFMVLRRQEDLEASGGPNRARLSGAAIRSDAAHLTTPQVRGQVAAMAAALRSAGLQPADVGYCNAHGTATLAGDPVECEALRQIWGDAAAALNVSSTKAAHGHLLGAGGALEAAWTVLALQSRVVPATRGVTAIDPRCAGLLHVSGEGRETPTLRHALSNSFAFGGVNASLVFSRV